MLLGVDVGGTFTDAVLLGDAGLHTAKVPSTPADQSRGVLAAVRAVLESAGAQPSEVSRFAHGMTIATNALLEGNGARTALVATEGFADIVELARQARPSLYRLCEAGPRPLVGPELRFEACERMGPNGPLRALDDDAARLLADAVAAAQPEAIAIVLLHSYADPSHERQLRQRLRERLPGVHISASHEVVGTFREYERAATTEVDAALSPLLHHYLSRLTEGMREQGIPEPVVMQSSGGLATAQQAGDHAALTVLSGPAGGAGAALLLCAAAPERDVLCFDMGGTSCDVCVIEDLKVRETAQRSVGGRPLALPMLDIHTVGAGGGSIAWRDAGGALRVGPRSAGADPGPACYGRGGERPTVTDANLLLGYLPSAGSLAGGVKLDAEAARTAVGALARELELGLEDCAAGIVRVANAEMLRALRVMTVERGIDPRRFALLPFGGAGPLHAVAIAEELGIERVLCPRGSGVLSALGLAAGAPRHDAARSVLRAGQELTRSQLAADVAELRAEAARGLQEEPERMRVRYELRYHGQSFELAVEAGSEPDPRELRAALAREHRERYGYAEEAAEIELVTIRVSVWGRAPQVDLSQASDDAPSHGQQRVRFGSRWEQAELWEGALAPGFSLTGPAICALPDSTLVVAPGWRGEVDALGTIVLTRGDRGGR